MPKQVMRGAFLPLNHPTYTTAVIFGEINDVMSQVVEHCVTIPRNGYWLHSTIRQCSAGRQKYRIPYRAVVNGIEKLEISNGNTSSGFCAMDQVTENHAQIYESFNGTTGTPQYYCIRGDQLELLPTPNSNAFSLRITYYVQPNRIVTSQSSTQGGDAVVRGQVTSISNIANRQITVNVLPKDQEATGFPNLVQDQLVDVIHPNGSYELAVVGAQVTNIAGTVLTLGGTDDLSEIELGDFVRVAEQTDWVPVPNEFHRMVCDMGSVKIMLQTNQLLKAEKLAQSVAGDYGRFQALLNMPRTRRQPKRIGARLVTRGTYWPAWRWR
jgi:hypothetical protein